MEHGVVAIAAILAMRKVVKVCRNAELSQVLKAIPGAQNLLDKSLASEVDSALVTLFPPTPEGVLDMRSFPEEGISHEVLKRTLEQLQQFDASGTDGKSFAYIYDCGDAIPNHNEHVEHAFNMFMHENALNPTAFPSLRRFEVEVIRMVIDMLHGDEECVGNMTSGGTESILCAIKTYRERARDLTPHITKPEMVLPITAHPAFQKAAHLFDVKPVYVPFDPVTFRADVDALEAAINSNTILIVGSAPQYPHGVVDPVEEMAKIALAHDLPLHVDACIGGFMLPWVEALGRSVPSWDFRVKGVTSVSADIHKYGFCPKGASALVYANAQIRMYQFVAYAGWPGGLFVSPSLLGSRNGGAIAAAWYSMCSLGRDGFKKTAQLTLEATDKMRAGINEIDGLEIMGDPHMTILAFRATDPSNLDVQAVADVMKKKFGWNLERQQLPSCLHMSVMPPHAKVADVFLANLQEAVNEVRDHPELSNQGTAAMYGLIAKIPSGVVIEQFLSIFMSKVYQ